jgi:hypothetical protein
MMLPIQAPELEKPNRELRSDMGAQLIHIELTAGQNTP